MATVTPYLCAKDTAAALEFYAAAFGAVETARWTDPSTGAIGHAEFTVEDARVMIADEWPAGGVYAPEPGRSSVSLVLEVSDVDGLFERAVAAGATVERPLTDSPAGRGGWLRDPFGHRWNLSASAPPVTKDELRAAVGDDYVIS